MGRSYRAPLKSGRYGRPEPAQETVSSDGDECACVWLTGDAIGMSPEDLLAFALGRLAARDHEIEHLLRHLPRKFEDRVEALNWPRREAESAINAAAILIRNTRHALAEPPYENEE
jgi:hypothetical protein